MPHEPLRTTRTPFCFANAAATSSAPAAREAVREDGRPAQRAGSGVDVPRDAVAVEFVHLGLDLRWSGRPQGRRLGRRGRGGRGHQGRGCTRQRQREAPPASTANPVAHAGIVGGPGRCSPPDPPRVKWNWPESDA
jgi:hypothetical protein